MFDDRTIGGRRAVAGLGLALIGATATFGAVLGATLPARAGLEAVTVRSVTVPVSPLTLAVYGIVAVGTVITAAGLVVLILSRFDDG